MALKIRFQYPTGAKLGYSIERLSDGLFFDFSTSLFASAPVVMTSTLPEDQGSFLGRYKMTLTSTPAGTFTNGDYSITVHDLANSNAVVAQLASTIQSGDDAPQLASAPVNPTVLNSGFETPVIGAGQFQYNPAGATWSFANSGPTVNGGSGISGNASAFTTANPSAPQGTQVAFIQGTAFISQTVNNWSAGNYAILFQAAQRGSGNTVRQDLNILVDGNVVGTCTPSGSLYGGYYKTNRFTVTQGNHTISFVGVDTAKGDNTAFIDDVQVVSV